MARKLEVYRCGVCGNVVEVVHGGEGSPWCCGRTMRLFSEKAIDPKREEYFPVVERTGEVVQVVIGSKSRAMEKDHHIQWIEIIADGLLYRKYLKSGDAPTATFKIEAKDVRARAYCTQHGLCIER